MITMLLVISTAWLAYANGANDNVKGVASLIGSRTLSMRSALRLAAAATFAGSLCTTLFAASLVRAFGGKGILPDEVLAGSLFPLAVVLASSATVMLATRLGLPVSTTHAMLGGLAGAGVASMASQVDVRVLGTSFAAPLLISPFVAVLLTAPLYLAVRRLRRSSGLSEESCVCIGPAEPAYVLQSSQRAQAAVIAALPQAMPPLAVTTGFAGECESSLARPFATIRALSVLDGLHILSGTTLSFARGLNDTAKVIGPLMLVGVCSSQVAAVAAGLAMLAGGLFSVRRVATTMSEKITSLNEGQGTIANIVSSSLVILASRVGLPVSTTHVSCGSLFGIGVATRQGNPRMIGSIVTAWVTTLPLSMGLGMTVYWVGRYCGGA